MTIVVPMAGAGSRFAAAGFVDPKPLIKVLGIEMIRFVIHNLTPLRDHKFVFIAQQAHDAEYSLSQKLKEWAPGCEVVLIDGLTEGAACTVLAASAYIDNDQPLMIANSDQYVDYDINDYLALTDSPGVDGVIMTMTATSPKWSYIRCREDGSISEVREKEVISHDATVGIYNFAHGSDFVHGAKLMIERNERVNGEFYVAPVYNTLIADGKRFVGVGVGSDEDAMMGLGTPEDLELFVGSTVSSDIAEAIARSR